MWGHFTSNTGTIAYFSRGVCLFNFLRLVTLTFREGFQICAVDGDVVISAPIGLLLYEAHETELHGVFLGGPFSCLVLIPPLLADAQIFNCPCTKLICRL